MTVTNNNKKMIDLPFFELCNQAPTVSSALSAMTTDETGTSPFIYYLTGSTFYRYDTRGDAWQQLATPNVTPVTALALRMTKRRGFHGRVLSATSTSVNLPSLRGAVLNGESLSILSGTGQGQTRTLTYLGETVHDAGVITATTTSSLGNGLKKWKINQWAGYTVGITFGTDATQYKKILYNDATTLYVADANLQPHDPWNNQIFVAAAPYALPVTTAGAQAHYQIMSASYSVPAWDVVPDYTSYMTVLTGGIYLVSSAAGAPWFTFQYYDIAHDSWQTKTVPQGLIGAALGTDFSIERTGKPGSALATNLGTVSGGSRTLTDSGQSLTANRFANHRLVVTGGTGAGQDRRIVANTATVFTVARPWDTAPDNTSTFEVWPDFDRVFLAGNGSAAMYAYSPGGDYWMQGASFDDGITTNIAAKMEGWVPVGVTTGIYIAAGVRAVNSVPTAGGSGYVIGDVLTCAVGGAGAQVQVTSIAPGGVVTGLELYHAGTTTGYTTGTGKATTGGTGTGCTIEITTVGATALITTATANWFKRGHKVTFSGCTAAAWNAEHTIIGVNSTTTFSVAVTATASMAATATQSTTTIVDPSKNWTVNEHVGRIVHLMVAGTAPTSQVRWITANTATTLTVATITAGVNGTSKYVIYDAKAFGVDDQRKESDQKAYGFATGGSTTTLVDATKNWVPNQWAGYLFKIEAGTGFASGRISIISNTETTLTFATQSFSPDATTYYEIADTWGLMSAGSTTTLTEATGKNWATNQWAGKRVRITAGTAAGQEAIVASNTGTVLTTGTITSPDATSVYSILSIPPRGTGIELVWAFNSSDPAKKGRYMYLPRGGGSNTLDIYDITTGKWNFGRFIAPQAELFTTGSSYAYDGADTLYLSRSVANQPIRIMAYDIKTDKVRGAFQTAIIQGTAHIGNAMEIVTSPDGLSYLFILQNTGTILVRALIF